MKKIIGFFIGIHLILASFCVSAQQNEQKPIVKQETSAEKPQMMGLDLSSEQKAQLAEIKKSIALDRSALKQASGNDKEVAVKMVEEYQQKIFDAFKEILTDEQLAQYEKNMEALENIKQLNSEKKKQSNPE